ncbi:PhoP regulatory network protein YrbL [Erwinia sp. CPCC 100877]|nr:PhoP regulatory network protein YrbL [Erwinia sp. CPCC 100877]
MADCVVRLSDVAPLGTGRHRKCYLYPGNPDRCIKIVYNPESGGDKELQRELKYYAHLDRRLKDWSSLPAYHGTVETDLGTGYVYDIVKDYDGSISVSLDEFARQCRENGDLRLLRQTLATLKAWLIEHHIVTMNLKPQNILCRRLSPARVMPVVVDNIGEATLLPLATWSRWFCHRKQSRQWKRFMTHPLFTGLEQSQQQQTAPGFTASHEAG